MRRRQSALGYACLTTSRRSLRHRISVFGELFDVLHHAVQLPLPINFLLSAQRESIEALVVSQVAEYRLNGRETLTIQALDLFAARALLHALRVR